MPPDRDGGITGYVGVMSPGDGTVFPAEGIPVFLYGAGSDSPVAVARTDACGRYRFDIPADADGGYAVEAAWRSDAVRLLDTEGNGSCEIAVRSPAEGYTPTPAGGRWEELIFEDTDAASDYHLARSLFLNFEAAHDYVNRTFGYPAPQVTVCIHCPGLTVPEHRFGTVCFGSDVASYPVPEGDQVWHEYGHAVHFFRSDPAEWRGAINRSFKEGWACYFGYELSPDTETAFDCEPNRNYGATDPRYTADIRRGMVIAGIFRDIADGADPGDADPFDGAAGGGDRAIWTAVMEGRATDIDAFFVRVTSSADEAAVRAIAAIYATHGLIAPCYEGVLEGRCVYLPSSPAREGDLLAVDVSVENMADHTLDYELRLGIADAAGRLLLYETLRPAALSGLAPGGTAAVICRLPLELSPGSYTGTISLVPADFCTIPEEDGSLFRSSPAFIDSLSFPVTVS